MRIALFSMVVLLSAPALGAQVWVGDMETGDTSQWGYELNPQNITIVQMPIAQGSYAAHIELTNDATWPNGLKRVELQHAPAAGRTAEGAELYWAWSFYLPDTLPTDPSQQIGYWESGQSYQQMMAFEVTGEHIRFVTRQPQNQNQWEADGMVTAGVWHRIAMHLVWSKDPAIGLVDVWFDGVQVVTGGSAKTLNDDNPHFTQVGLLRGAIDFQDAPVIILDDAVEGDTLADVHPEPPGMGTGGGGGMPGTGGGAATTTSGAGGGSASSASGGIDPVAPSDEDSGCALGSGSTPERAGLWLLLAALFARRRRA